MKDGIRFKDWYAGNFLLWKNIHILVYYMAFINLVQPLNNIYSIINFHVNCNEFRTQHIILVLYRVSEPTKFTQAYLFQVHFASTLCSQCRNANNTVMTGNSVFIFCCLKGPSCIFCTLHPISFFTAITAVNKRTLQKSVLWNMLSAHLATSLMFHYMNSMCIPNKAQPQIKSSVKNQKQDHFSAIIMAMTRETKEREVRHFTG